MAGTNGFCGHMAWRFGWVYIMLVLILQKEGAQAV